MNRMFVQAWAYILFHSKILYYSRVPINFNRASVLQKEAYLKSNN